MMWKHKRFGQMAYVGVLAGMLFVVAYSASNRHRQAARTSAPLREENLPQRLPQEQTSNGKSEERGEVDARTHGAPTFASEMARQRFRMRLGDDGTFPDNALVHAKAQADAMEQLGETSNTADAGIWDWEWLGPGNIGGRVRSLAIHPDDPAIMFAGSASGGLWRTDDAGGSWFPVDDFLASLAVPSVIFDPTNPNTMYAGTGEGVFGGGMGPNGEGGHDAGATIPGEGIFVSHDGGTSWELLPGTEAWDSVNRIVHHPSQSGVMFAATNEHGLQRSEPNGAGLTWSCVLETNTALTDVEIDPTGPDCVVVGGKIGVWISKLQGNPQGSFVKQTTGAGGKLPSDGGRCEVAFGAGGRLWASINRNGGEIWLTQDHGSLWLPRSTGSNFLCNPFSGDCFGNFTNAIWASPDDPDLVVVGGINVFRSRNGGMTLQQVSGFLDYPSGESAHADQHMFVSPPDYGPLNRKVFVANDGGIQRINDVYTVVENAGWTNLANNLGITQFYGGSAAPDGSVIVGGTQDNGNLRYRPEDGAQDWFQCAICQGDGGISTVDAINPNNIYITRFETPGLFVMTSNDGGSNYIPATIGLGDVNAPSQRLQVAPFVMDPGNPENLVAGGRSIWYSTNGALRWNSIRDPIPNDPFSPSSSAIDVDPNNGVIVWVGYLNGTVSHTTTAGLTTWINVDNADPDNLMPNRWVTDIAVNPSNSDEVFVTFGGYRSDTIWFTPDGGSTWSIRHGAPGSPNSLPEVHINTVRWHPTAGTWVYIGTDLGVYASEDKGVTWRRTPRYGVPGHDGPANVEVSELFWQGDYLVAATFGRGMYRTRPLEMVYVDGEDIPPGSCEDGTLGCPFNTVQEGIEAQGHGTDMSISAGEYNETGIVVFSKRGDVHITGNGAAVIR